MSTIHVKNLKKHFGKTKAIDGISFEIEKGEIFGFLGPNGAGKTTTIRCLMDFIRPDEGSISILGKDAQEHSVELKNHIGYLSGDVCLQPRWTGNDHINFFKQLIHENNSADELVRRLDFNPNIKTRSLSSGNKQKLGIIIALMSNPDIIILDEPTNGLDPFLQRTVYDLIDEARDRGATIFMSSHNLNEVEHICDRVGVIRQGKMVAVESMKALKKKRLYSVHVTFSQNVEQQDLVFGHVEVERKIPGGYILSVKNDINPLLKKLSTLQVEDLEVSHASLEEIFMEFYK